MNQLYACIYVPEFPAQALLRLRPDVARLPLAVLAGDPPLEQVCSTNRLSARLGVLRGMTRAELEMFPGLCILKQSSTEEMSTRTAIMEAAGGLTPRMEMQPQDPSAFVLVLDMTGSHRLFGDGKAALGRIADVVKELQLHARLAASANLHTAVCVAPFATRGPILIPPGKERIHLEHLPLAALRLADEQAETMALWGLRTVGELACLPETDLVVRMGREGRRLWLLARGEHPHLMVPEEPVFTLEENLAFDAPVDHMDSLLFVLGPMLGQLVARTKNHALALASVTLKMGLDGGGQHERTIKPALPLANRETLLKLLHLDLQANPPDAGVLSLWIRAEPGDRSKVQLGLFSPQLPESVRLDLTLARIAALVGANRVGRARLVDSHRADSFVMERFTVPEACPVSCEGRQANALRRCRPPQEITVQRSGERLSGFSLRGKQYRVREAFGPWRTSGEWWSPQAWAYEEWDVKAEASEERLVCVLRHDLLCEQWQLEALYD